MTLTARAQLGAVFPADLIRPWYPAGITGHIYADCPDLLFWEPEPKEGAGWLDPRQPDPRRPVCEPCVRRHDPKIHAEVFGSFGSEDGA